MVHLILDNASIHRPARLESFIEEGMVRAMRLRECRQAELIALFGLESFLGKKLGKLSGGTMSVLA